MLDTGALAGDFAECLLISTMQGALAVLRKTRGLKRSLSRMGIGSWPGGAGKAFGKAVDQGTMLRWLCQNRRQCLSQWLMLCDSEVI